MNTKKPAEASDVRHPVSEKFEKFERNYGGDAVNAHDDRMISILNENAEKLEAELTRKDGEDGSTTRKK